MSDQRKWLKSADTLLFEVADGVATITLNRPEKRNALGAQMLEEFRQALLEADDRTDVNVILMRGAGRDFCAGYDLMGSYGGAGDAAPAYDPAQYRTRAGTLDDDIWNLARQQDLTLILLDLHKPVVAEVQGNCLAGGTDLAFSCDLVIVADDAKIGFPAARANGTPPTNLWLYHCGPQWAKRMLFTGDTISGLDAARIGLALESYPPDRLADEALALARRIAHVDAEILATHKRVVNLQLELAGARTAQRFAAELDARAHLSQGPRRRRFRQDMAESGLKEALKQRDAPFGDGRVRLRARGQPD
ncbi:MULTISPECIES: crotonase/enoyl-CoA hydratase family protein [Azospirillaceae]|uniref:Enoyl-CoA hydratase n=1 Tax=Nitrospirillum viridazoti CBAmc TaxID=1441467 RepID=A0A248JVR5_9PROT|nr:MULTISPECIES: crotonase/enoyl-CoA hydratase family protein [Azospirillaceae]ASG22218.1 enoyl-CoA hydratase [Nitrospirillum amazonense CBAmc]TWB31017.1 enoyl-CoA hydratase [Nitrospirillum amazonense]